MPIDPALPYDDQNIFARILRGEIPAKTVYQDAYALAFHDISPLAPTHVLVIPKGPYVSWDDFSARASEAEIAGFVRAVGQVARAEGLVEGGYRLLANIGGHGGQEVAHLHVHLFGGRPLGPMLARLAFGRQQEWRTIMPTALIVGASRGLGRALVEEHLNRGWQVIATVRRAGDLAQLASNVLRVETLDTTDWAGVDALRQRLADYPLDLVFVNAAIIGPSAVPIGEANPDAFAEMMLVNVLAPLRIVDRFADLVGETGTVAVMSSGLGSIAGNTTGGWEAYRTSKAALDQGLRSIAARRADRRTYLACDPGWVRTDMGGPSATLSVSQSIPNLVAMLEARRGSGGCAFVTYQNRELPW